MGHPSSHIFLCRWYNLIGLENSGSISGSIFYSSPAGLQLCRPMHHRRILFPGIFTGYLHSSSRAPHRSPCAAFFALLSGHFHRSPCAALSALLTRAPARLFSRFFPRISSSCPRGFSHTKTSRSGTTFKEFREAAAGRPSTDMTTGTPVSFSTSSRKRNAFAFRPGAFSASGRLSQAARLQKARIERK